MYQILSHIKEVPPFIKGAFANHTILAIILLVIFVVAVLMTNKVATLCRYITIILAIGAGTVGFVFKKFPYFWTSVGVLAVLIAVRLLLYTIRTIRQNRIDRRIEERALAKAAARRGSWKNRQGYSGHARAIEDDYIPGQMSRDEIRNLIENETLAAETAAQTETAEVAEAAAQVEAAVQTETADAAEAAETTVSDKMSDIKEAAEAAVPEAADAPAEPEEVTNNL